jgi:hypothetical protein
MNEREARAVTATAGEGTRTARGLADALRLGDLRRALLAIPRFLVDWLPLVVVLFLYDEIHNRLGRFVPPPHTWPQIRLDEWLFGGTVPTILLQRALYSSAHPAWWDYAALAIYTSHFFFAIAVGLGIWFQSRARFHRYTSHVVALTTLGYATYLIFPAVPPWLASQHGDLAATHRIVRELWDFLGRHDMAALFSGTNVFANDVAAIPSLHAAYPLLIAVFFWKGSGRVVRAVLALYALLMPLVLVYCAEHYVLDILLGWIYVVPSYWAVERVWARFSARPGRSASPSTG